MDSWKSPALGYATPTQNSIAIRPISGTGEATNFKFCTDIHRTDRLKSPLKFFGKEAVDVVRASQKYSGRHYNNIAHRAVFLAIARPSCHFSCRMCLYNGKKQVEGFSRCISKTSGHLKPGVNLWSRP